MSYSFNYVSVPSEVLRPLLIGFSGRVHLHALARVAMTHSTGPDDAMAAVARDALLSAWAENPFDGNCAAALASAMDSLPPVDASLLPALKGVLSAFKPDASPEARDAMAGEADERLAFLSTALVNMPDNLFWWHHLYEHARITGQWDVVADKIAQASAPSALEPLFRYARANGLLASGREEAGQAYADCLETLAFPLVRERLATACLRAGERERGVAELQRCVMDRPWNVSLWQRLNDLKIGSPDSRIAVDGKTMVLVYSWNKADDLAETLDSLAASNLGDAEVRVLDNGSTDGTGDVIDRFVDRMGSDRAAKVSLPVNVGAPAARNWLLSLPEVRESDNVAFIDDDIALPTEWLDRLGVAVARYPQAGVWGCKVVDYNGPARVQCGEHNLNASEEDRREALMSTVMLQDGDFGQADYIRPCASVTGCVHLFKTERLLENGHFDLRFSPTQYDDLERDLRMVKDGGYAVYTGFLAVPHKRTSGRLSDSGQPDSAGAAANLNKLKAMYSPADLESMAAHMEQVLKNDVLNKMAVFM